MKKINWLLIILLITACGGNDNSGEIEHPTPQNLPTEGEGNVIQTTDININKYDITQKILADLRKMEKDFIMGSRGEEDVIFGEILDVVVDARGRMYVMDSKKHVVQVFNREGNHLQTLGGKGKGPGKFEHPKSMVTYNNEMLLVGHGYRIEAFDIEGDKIEFLKTVQLNKWRAHSLSICNGRLFVHNNQLQEMAKKEGENHFPMIRAYTMPNFKPEFTFGESYKSDDPFVISRFTEGRLSCNETTSTILFAFDRHHVLHGYSAKTGKLKWKTLVDGLKFHNITQSTEGGKTILAYSPSRKWDEFVPPVTYKGKYEILQVRRNERRKGTNSLDQRTITLVLNSATGDGSLISKNIPPLAVLTGRSMVAVSNDLTTASWFSR